MPYARVNPTRAILWYIVKANQGRMTAVFGYWVFVAVLANTVLAHSLATYDSMARYGVAMILVIPAVAIPLLLAACFSMEANWETLDGYPAYLMRQPVPSLTLSTVPMAIGLPVVSLSWVIVALTVLQPLGLPTHLLPSTVGTAGGLLIIQALCWAPVGKVAKLLLFGAVLGAIAGTAVLVSVRELNPHPFLALYAVASILAAVAATNGVRMSRRGDRYEIHVFRTFGQWLAATLNRRPRFSGFDGPTAQLWFDRTVEGFPLIGAMIWVFIVASPTLFSSQHPSLVEGRGTESWPVAGIATILWVKVATFAPLVALLLAALLGNNPLPSTYGYRRPLSTIQLAQIKVRSAMSGVWATVGLLAGVAGLALLTPASEGGRKGFLGALLAKDLSTTSILPIALVVALYVVTLIRARLDGVWASTLKLTWYVVLQLVLPWFAWFGLCVWSSYGELVWGFIMSRLVVLATIAAVLKIGAYVAVASKLSRDGLTNASAIGRQVSIWTVSAILLTVLASASLPSTFTLPTIIALAISAIPIVRVSLITWAVDRARHQ